MGGKIREKIREQIARLKWSLWHGQVDKALGKLDDLVSAIAPFDGPKDVFGFFQIGLNPGARVIENPGDYRPLNAAGLVTIGIGDNVLQGGDNKVKGQGGFTFPIVNATVTVDDKTVVQNGKLTF